LNRYSRILPVFSRILTAATAALPMVPATLPAKADGFNCYLNFLEARKYPHPIFFYGQKISELLFLKNNSAQLRLLQRGWARVFEKICLARPVTPRKP